MRRLLVALTILSLLSLLPQGAGAVDAPTAAVSIKGMAFIPAAFTVKSGTTVTWTNNDDRDHSVVAADGSFNSGNISRGGTFSYKFDKAGKFEYACQYHPRMKGTVVVQ